jgi:hypothetical protein
MGQEKYDYAAPLKPPPITREQESLLKRIFSAVERFFDGLGKALEKLFTLSGYAGIAVWAAFVVLPVFLIVLLVRRLARAPAAAGPAPVLRPDTVTLDHRRELDRAADLIARRRFREAVSSLITSLWLFYHHADVVAFDAGLTNREYSEKIGDRPEAGAVRNVVAAAEKAVYAEGETGEEECRRLFEEVRSLVS